MLLRDDRVGVIDFNFYNKDYGDPWWEFDPVNWGGDVNPYYCTGLIKENMTNDEEKAFLSRFEELATKGQIITINDIASAYDDAVGVKHESLSTVYYLLHKHGWRKVAPKQYHPGKASDEVIETSKKLTMS